MSGRHWPKSSSPAPRTWPPARASAWSWWGSRWPTRSGRGPIAIPAGLLGADAAALVARADVDVVVEVIGGLHPAHELIEAALRNGKPVVTANKALLAVAGAELAEVAAAAGVDLLYEAAVAGAIPVIRPLRESLAGEQIVRVMGIVNGTTNYILTRMEEEGADYDDVLREAQELGHGRARPDGRRRGPRRRGQGRHPRRARLRERRRRRRRVPGGHQRHQRGRRRLRHADWAIPSSSWPSPS